ncbi:MAG: L-glutamate gamma-semialdehyde dehydrogenase [Phycisphaerae bacterium]
MDRNRLDERIISRGMEFFDCIGDERPSAFNRSTWSGKLIEWCMRHEPFKVQLFRFVDVLPALATSQSLSRHLDEYFAGREGVPEFLKVGLAGAGLLGGLGERVLGRTIRGQVEGMARQFIVGADAAETVAALTALRRDGFAFTLDVLGEATVSEDESERYVATYLALLDELAGAQKDWPALGGGAGDLDWGHAPRINVSVKPSALYSQASAMDFEGSAGRILERLRVIGRKVVAIGGFMCIDMEAYRLKDLTLEVYRRLREDGEFRDYPRLGVAVQAYLRDTDRDTDDLLAWARQRRLRISIRLVKGAYWDQEVVIARQNNWPVPVYTVKAQTDASFERNAEKLLRHSDICHLACGTHNVRTASAVMEMAREFGVPEDRYEFQVLHGMAEPFRKALLKLAGRVRLYCPHGAMLPGMAYLIRRLLENTSNESFLRQTFTQKADEGLRRRLLADPRTAVEEAQESREEIEVSRPKDASENSGMGVSPARSEGVSPAEIAAGTAARRAGQRPTPQPADAQRPRDTDDLPPFRNEPTADFTHAVVREAFTAALAAVRKQLGRTHRLFIGGKDVATDDLWDSVNPARPAEIVGRICQAGVKEVDAAIGAAHEAFRAWRDVRPRDRAEHLIRAAAVARKRIYELAAWQVFEVGKQWNQACADVCEAIDFLEYYARQMIRLGGPWLLGDSPGELNEYVYQPKGVAAVIAPWNFPLAISCGMCAAAIVAGNCVVYKPSEHSPVVGRLLCDILREAGLPPGVLNFIPGRREVIGDYLIDHPRIALVAFTGSMQVGLRIVERAARTGEGQTAVKRVIAEMGGKNAIIIDDDADLDEAVPAVIQSAFGYAGQKCSACSRAIVLGDVYERFVERLIPAARSLRVGPPENPANFLGPVISAAARDKVMRYVELARQEGAILYQTPPAYVPADGFYAPITVVGGISPQSRLAQEEIFGPVLAVMRVEDFDQAVELANSTPFALTGGVFSRSPSRIEKCRQEFQVGNLYINRAIVGAIVGRQPFGGLKLSGVGAKAGGPDYLLQFMDARTIAENTMRRGFASE